MSEERICKEGKIWDLHIHSNQCKSVDDEQLTSLSIPEYVQTIIDVLEKYDDLEMISFTDHNRICVELYKEFYKAKSRIALLPGIEIDVQIDEGGAGKHLIVYFDSMDDLEKLESVAERLNTFLDCHHVGSGPGKEPIDINILLDELVGYGVHFALSPHAMKQGKRGIDSDWHAMPENEYKTEAKKYLDQFFCFWESSGKTEIAHAVEFLHMMLYGDRISIIAFSDSKSIEELREYLNDPPQYFNALPNFNGLKMVGSEQSRITEKKNVLETTEIGNYIGRINIFGQDIELSPRLNAIIGGRGKGKSILLDSIANYLDPAKGNINKKRREFISSLPIVVSSMNDTILPSGAFHFDYYNQSYIASLFDKSGNDFNDELESYFEDAFSQVPTIDAAAIERENAEAFAHHLVENQPTVTGNVVGLVEKLIIDNKDKLSIKILKKMKHVEDPALSGFDYKTYLDTFECVVRDALPSFIKPDSSIDNAINQLMVAIIEAAHESRLSFIEGDAFINDLIDKFVAKKKEISDAQKEREAALESFENAFANEVIPIKKRVALVNALIKASCDLKRHYEESRMLDGEKAAAFQFKHELSIEHPFDFMVRAFNDHLYALPNKGQCNRDNLKDYIFAFCFDEEGYKQGSTWKKLYEELKSYKLNYIPQSSICYLQDDGKYGNIATLSPGTQTNILIEYIVYKDEDIPLLIDQPEDNVDNQTIYNKIRKWFMSLKKRRQVIVVTHDANIVINADAENVILADQEKPGKFVYDYGALEYGDLIDRSSLILDGGKDAVKRRLIKYGE